MGILLFVTVLWSFAVFCGDFRCFAVICGDIYIFKILLIRCIGLGLFPFGCRFLEKRRIFCTKVEKWGLGLGLVGL